LASRAVALTFDDGPDPRWTPRVLEALDRVEVQATFFVVGTQVEQHPQLIELTLAAGHTVEVHCFAHEAHPDLTRASIEDDIDKALAALASAGSPRPALWRPPLGALKRPDSFEIAAARQLTLVGWTADPRDYEPESSSGQMLRALVPLRKPRRSGAAIRQLRLRRLPRVLHPGAVVLLHDARLRASSVSCENTVELILPLVEALRGQGWEFKPLSLHDHPSVIRT
jgi:peptidoglycan/xylan/chitin deacetylase (PgdA/CDA1 family)